LKLIIYSRQKWPKNVNLEVIFKLLKPKTKKDVQNKVDKARTFTDFKFRKPLFISKKGMDKEIDSSYSQSVSTK